MDVGAHTALIGGNGAGKSSILKALEKFYSTAKTLDADDYYGRDQTEPVEIELTFDELTAAAAEHFESRVRDGRLVVTRIFDNTPSSGRYFGSVPQNPDFGPIRAQLAANPKREAYRNLREQNPAYAALPPVPSAAAVDAALLDWEADHQDQLVLCRDDGQFFGFQNASRGALQRFTTFVFVPAVREAGVDAADGKSSAIGRLVELIVRGAILQRAEFQAFKEEVTQRYQHLVAPENMPELGELANQLTADIKGLYQDAAVGLAWRSVDDFPVPLPLADVSLSDDGFGGPVDRQGHGLQRAFVITLLQHLARTSTSTQPQPQENEGAAPAVPDAPNLILAIEEPELYQHPTKQRHFADVLRRLSEGALPGQDGPTQVIFASHSPMFVSMSRPDEIRLVRRTDCDEGEFKQCELRALNLETVAERLGTAWLKPPGTYTKATLMPRLHILGIELSEGFFANGVVLVEGRSDKAALAATARLLDVSFESAGIAILSAEGKDNIDRPLLIFRELGIPTFAVWDCDIGTKDHSPAKDLALLRMCGPAEVDHNAPAATGIGDCFAHFEVNLEATLKADLPDNLFETCLQEVCAPLGLPPSRDAQKVPEVMYRTLSRAREQGHTPQTLISLTKAIWLMVTGKAIGEPTVQSDPALAAHDLQGVAPIGDTTPAAN